MERIDVAIKVVAGMIGAIVSWMVGFFGLGLTVLLGFMALDFLSGLLVGWVKKELSSSVGREGFAKKLHIVMLIGGAYLIDLVFLKSNGVVPDSIAFAYCAIEFISLVENSGKLGVPIGPFRTVIAAVKHQQDTNK